MFSNGFLLAHYVAALEWLTVLTAIIIIVSGIDDAFIDAYFWVREAYRATFLARRIKPLPIEALRRPPEQAIAIMVPAWQESAVIAQMIENSVATLEYSNFKIFCGTYPNDPATGEIVDRMARRYKQVVHVSVPHDGPTCKADCLNWIIQAIFLNERTHAIEFAGIVLHDSEDVIDPLELKLYNYLLPRKDLIQLPVLSLDRQWHELVAGTYMDDFAEWHSKDLVVRESFTGQVPSAGVGTCFSHRAMAALSAETNNQPFNTDTLTEDYDFSYRLAKLHMSQVFVRFPIEYKVRRRHFLTGREREVSVDSYVAVREFFPDKYRAAYRQRARWIVGIVFQGWLEMAWKGDWRSRYMLVRDRKGVVTSVVTILAYFILLNFVLIGLVRWYDPNLMTYSSMIASHEWIQMLLAFNFLLLCNRIGQRFYFVSRFYGLWQGVMTVPRLLVNNLINFNATMRAWKLFVVHVIGGRKLTWDKTDHAYPSMEQLQETRKRLGEVLLAWKAIDQAQIDEALARQTELGEPLGRVLLREGWLREDALADALAYQHGLPRAEFDQDAVLAHSERLPLPLVIRHRVLVAGDAPTGGLHLLAAGPPDTAVLEAAAAQAGQPPLVSIVRESDIADGLRLVTGIVQQPALEPTAAPPLLGDLLIEMGALRRQDLSEALDRYEPARDGRFGQFLIAHGRIDAEDLQAALERQNGFAPELVNNPESTAA
ncbi:bacteriophage N4 adsorption protein B [Aliidongia dinghuensis]|uniref:Bacteriophage N4 adsorption protein B n=1 Tax=Aliidongia dinghuensis TaxID=1867774 RepID=A0A8J2YTK6_9PROT|nr:glycosyl transferase family protein [Aliidongia dinghuensis]GGF19932.1 bacteriophage N4 adsorption protein B [Aliidongia dinghuensis]